MIFIILDLYAVVVHYGSTLFSGHYVAFVKVEGVWVLADDKEVLIWIFLVLYFYTFQVIIIILL
jgi:ubiquitin C-terminal hydrolase